MSNLVRSHWWSVFFVLFFPLLIMYMYSDFIRSSELNARLGWLVMLGGLAYLLRHTVLQKLLLGVLVLFTLSGSLDIVYAITFGGVFVSATFEALALTDPSEALEFIQAYISLENVVVLALYWGIAYYSLKRILFREAVHTREKIVAGLGVLMVLVAIQQIIDRGRTFDVLPGFTGVAIDYSLGHEAMADIVLARRHLYDNSTFKATLKSDKPQTYIVVIGESLGRKHLSLYGYARDTTPNLDKVKDDLIVFNNTISAYAQTKPSLSVNLTISDTLNKRAISESISLVGAFKRAGFKTFWISNQQPLRVPTKPMATIADEQHFISHDFHGVEVKRYDGYLLPSVKHALEDKARHKVIFVHLMGSHLQYKNRYPSTATYFQGLEGVSAYKESISDSQLEYINAYDDSVRYTDSVLGEMISYLKGLDQISALTFWSDHGEEVFDTKDFKGHGPDGVTSAMLEVPFIFWRNKAYQKAFSVSDNVISGHVNAPVMLDDFFHIAHCMIPVESDLVQKNKSLCATVYDAKPRIVYGKNYDKAIK